MKTNALHLFLLLSILTALGHALGSSAWADEFPLKPADRRALEALLQEHGGSARLREIAITGKATRPGQGQAQPFVCDRQNEPEYCLQVTAWICHQAAAMAESAEKNNNEVGIARAHEILNRHLLDDAVVEDMLFKMGKEALGTAQPPRGVRPADEIAPLAGQLRHAVQNRDVATAEIRAALARSRMAAAFATSDLMIARHAILNEIPMEPPAKERARAAEERIRDFTGVLQSDLMMAYGRIPEFNLAFAMDGTAYVTFEVKLPSGETGQVTSEFTPREPGPHAGPTLIPIAMRPNQGFQVPVKAFTPALACYFGARGGEPLAPLTMHGKLVQMPGQEPFTAIDLPPTPIGKRTLIPRERQTPFLPFYIATDSRPESRFHPAELRGRMSEKIAAEDAGAGAGAGVIQKPAPAAGNQNH